MASIMIMGDSWACGEWAGHDTAHVVTHPGTRQYLRQRGHDVISVARGGHGNATQVDRLRVYTEDPGRPTPDHIIWFLSDPCRDIPHTAIARTMRDYRAQRDLLLRRQFDRVAHLPMALIGGVAPVPAWVDQEYPGFTTLVPDLRRWLLPHANPCEVLCRTWRYPECDPGLLSHWEQQERTLTLHEARARQPTTAEHQWFWPDPIHPNRAAHLRLVDHVIQPYLAQTRRQ
jgi:hypothetical protein